MAIAIASWSGVIAPRSSSTWPICSPALASVGDGRLDRVAVAEAEVDDDVAEAGGATGRGCVVSCGAACLGDRRSGANGRPSGAAPRTGTSKSGSCESIG